MENDHETIHALVLMQRSFLENDRILTLLTPDRGVIEVLARRIRSVRSKLAPACAPLCYSEFCIFHGKTHITVDSGTPLHFFYRLRFLPERLALGEYFCELAKVLTPDPESGEKMLRLLLNTLTFLEKEDRHPELLKGVFELRIACIAGFQPDLVACAHCASYESEPMYFLPREGVLLCRECAQARPKETGAVPLRAAVLKAMRQIVYGSDKAIFSFSLKKESRDQLSRVSESYLRIHTDLTSRALTIYRALAPSD